MIIYLPRAMDLRAWETIDAYELRTGHATLRRRARRVERDKLLAIEQEAAG
jgi:hypothetical protein